MRMSTDSIGTLRERASESAVASRKRRLQEANRSNWRMVALAGTCALIGVGVASGAIGWFADQVSGNRVKCDTTDTVITYIQPGQTLNDIALGYGGHGDRINVAGQIANLNGYKNANIIPAGERISLPRRCGTLALGK